MLPAVSIGLLVLAALLVAGAAGQLAVRLARGPGSGTGAHGVAAEKRSGEARDR